MAPDARSSSQTNRERIQIVNKEGVTRSLEELWYFDPDGIFYKTFSREAQKVRQGVLDFNKEDLVELTFREDNDDLIKSSSKEVDKIRSSKN